MIPPILRHGFTLHGLAAGLCAFAALLLAGLPFGEAAMLGWCVHVTTYAVLLMHRLGNAQPETMRVRACKLADGRAAVLGLSVLAATASMLIVASQLAGKDQGVTDRVIAIITVIASWFYVHLLFAQEYAHEYWMNDTGIEFPGGDGTPEFGEFLYFGFTVGMTFQVSDMTTNTPRMRKLVLLHGLAAFAFNAVILASAVNTVANMGG